MEEIEVVCQEGEYLVARVKKAKMNQAVVDERGRIVGRVISVFGPTSRPYVKIRMQRKGGRAHRLGGDARWRKKRRRRSG